MRSELLSMLSSGMTELLMTTELDSRQLQFTKACQTSGRALLSLVNDILDLSKIEAGKLELDEHDFDLEQLVRDTTEMLWLRAHEKGLELICDFDPQARQIYSGDSNRLGQILINLLNNAVKFTERGEVILNVSCDQLDKETATLRFTIRDTGIGIPQDRANRLFPTLSQVDSSTTRKYGGTGLGLAICQASGRNDGRPDQRGKPRWSRNHILVHFDNACTANTAKCTPKVNDEP